jgi:hypothetical protein
LELTAAERALNEDTPPASPDTDDDLALPPVLDFGNSYPSLLLATPGSGTNPLATPGSGTNPTSALATGAPAPAAAQTPSATLATNTANNASASSCPPAKGGALPQRRGKTKDAPKKDDPTGAGMLMFMHKSQEQSSRWMMEERKRANND